jgi:acetyltransferase
MNTFFNPSSVVVIGASNSPFNLGATICRSLSEFTSFAGPMYAVNRKGEDVFGCTGYTKVTDIEGPVDLAVIIAPSKVVPEFVRQCGEKGIRHIVIESSGFSEGGEQGRALQRELDEIRRAYGIRIMGPNCLGVLNTENRFCCFYGLQKDDMETFATESGDISYIIQSGGIVVIVLESFKKDVVKAAKIVSIGNKSDIDEADMIEYYGADEKTRVIGMYLENISSGRKFLEKARKVNKPILAFKVGRTGEGVKAAQSHTAGMANNDLIFDAACRQAGIIRVNSISELHALPKIFTRMPPLRGRRIAVFTNSGAFGGITADLLVENGLEMARLSPETQERLSRTGQIFNVRNPIDLGPALSMQTFLEIFDILLSSDEVDGLLPVPSLWHPMVIEAIMELVKKCHAYGKPAAIYTPNASHKTIAYREKYDVPLFESPEEAVRALSVSFRQYGYSLMKEDAARKESVHARVRRSEGYSDYAAEA